MLQLNGSQWRLLIGLNARDSKGNFLGVITDQFIEDDKMVFVINEEYEIVPDKVNELIWPERYITLA